MKPTEQTATLLRALRQMEALDLDKLFASGIDVTVHSYTEGKPQHMERVSLYAEDFAPVKAALIGCLFKAVSRRKESLQRELGTLQNI